MGKQWKRVASAAYGCALTRLVLNSCLYYEYQSGEETGEIFFGALQSWLTGSLAGETVELLRKQSEEKMKQIIAIGDCFSVYEHVLRSLERRVEPEVPRDFYDEGEVLDHLMAFLASSPEASELNHRLQAVIGELPLRLTRQKYYAMMRDALSIYKGSNREGLDYILYMLRTSGMIELTEQEKETCGEYRDLLKVLEETDYSHITEDAFYQAQAALQVGLEKISEDAQNCTLFQEMVNDLLILCLTHEEALRDEQEEELSRSILNDLCTGWQSGQRGIPESVEEKLTGLEGCQEKYIEMYQRLEWSQESLAAMGEDGVRISRIDRLMSGSLFASLEVEPETEAAGQEAAGETDAGDAVGVAGAVVGFGSAGKDSKVSEAQIEQAMKELCARFDALFDAAPRPVVRAVMSATLAVLPISFFSLEEVEQYIQNSFGGCGDLSEKQACLEALQELMESEDYALE